MKNNLKKKYKYMKILLDVSPKDANMFLQKKCDKNEIVLVSNYKSVLKTNVVRLDELCKCDIDVFIVSNSKNKDFYEKYISSLKNEKRIYFFSTYTLTNLNDKCYYYKTIKINKIHSIIPSLFKEESKYVLNNNDCIVNTYKDSFRHLCLDYLDKIRNIEITHDINLNCNKEAVLIEYRIFPHTEVLLRNTILRLGTTWSYTIICGTNNYYFMKNIVNKINKNIKVINSQRNISSQNDYNNLLLSKYFWNLLSGEKILIYQEDTLIFKSNIDDFLKWDYIGAPFAFKCIEPNNVGNGGFSLRNKSKMLEILNNYRIDENDKILSSNKTINHYKKTHSLDLTPEDVYFSQLIQLYNIGKVSDFETAKKFSSETIFDEDSLGMHCIWHSCKQWKLLINKYFDKVIENNFDKVIENKVIENNFDKVIENEKNDIYLTKLDKFCELMNIVDKNDVLKNPKQEFRYFCYNYMDYIRMLELSIIKQNSYYEAVLIEFRCLPHLDFLIRNTINKLGEKWSQTIICGLDNYNFIVNIVNNIDRDIKVIKLNYENLNQNEYSNLLMTTDFWNLLTGEKILIYQEDSCIFKSNIDDFLEWDYIGAPWPINQDDNSYGVGNGGFSLRTKSVMIKILNLVSPFETNYNSSTLNYMKNTKLIYPPEDVYFTLNMINHKIGNLAPSNIASLFSSELIFNENSLGGHNFWLSNKKWLDYCRYHLFSYKLMSQKNYKILGIMSPYGLNIGGGENYLLQIAKYFINYKNCIIYLFINVDLATMKNTISTFIGENYLKYFSLFPHDNYNLFYKKVDYCFVMGNEKFPYVGGFAKSNSNNIYHCQFPFDIKNLSPSKKQLELLNTYNKIILNSEYTKHFYDIFTHEYLNNQQIHILYPLCFNNFNNFNNLNISKEENSFVMLGRIFKYNPIANNKNFDIALKYFEKLSESGVNNFKVYIIGKCYCEKELVKLKSYNIKNLQIIENSTEKEKNTILNKSQYIINLVGINRDKISECYAYEHFGISIIEGINNGCIPITVDGGFPSYYVEHLINGFKFNTEDDFFDILKFIICEKKHIPYNFTKEFLEKFSLLNYNKKISDIIHDI